MRMLRLLASFLPALPLLTLLSARGAVAVDVPAFVPVVLTANGEGGSSFTSELTLTNRGTTSSTVQLHYTAEAGGGTGTATLLLSPGAQLIIPDVIAFLKAQGLPIDASGTRLGTLALLFQGASSADAVAATVRTTTPVPPAAPIGRAGLAYAGLPQTLLLSGPTLLGALRVNAADRTNVALQNPSASDITIKISYYEGTLPSTTPAATRQETLSSGRFRQLKLTDIAPAAVQGWIRLELVAGAGPFNAYAVVNDNANSDGSFVAPVPEAELAGRRGLTLPVVVETSVFTTEVTITNASPVTKTVHLVFVSSSLETADHTFATDVVLAAGEQKVLDGFVQTLRASNPAAVPSGRTYTGPLLASVSGSGNMTGILLGARVLNAGGGGRYGLFFQALPSGLAVPYSPAAAEAWLYALQQNGENRTNVAFLNTGEADSSPIVLRVEVWNGATGQKAADLTLPSLAARAFTQINAALSTWAPGVTQAYVRVTRVSGGNPFLVYAVVNDGASPGLRSGDGAFVPMQTNLTTTERFAGAWHNTTFGSTGPMTMDLAVNWLVQNFTATITLGGNVFGGVAPPPFSFSGNFRQVGSTETTTSTPLGSCAVVATPSGGAFSFTSTCTSVPNQAISKFTFDGNFNGTTWTSTYTVFFGAGGSATGTFSMTRQ